MAITQEKADKDKIAEEHENKVKLEEKWTYETHGEIKAHKRPCENLHSDKLIL